MISVKKQPKSDEAVVVYLMLWDTQSDSWVHQGQRPHCAMAEPIRRCSAPITVWDVDGGWEEACTREGLHAGPHVVHAHEGLPILAWLVKR